MTIEEIKTAELETVEARALEIAGELETAEPETLDTLSAELDAIQERKAEIRAAAEEKRAAMRDAIDAAEIIETVEKQEERKTMEKVEVRSTPEYLDAWVENIKGRANEEQRALLSTNASGSVAVPLYVEDGIRTAWENNEFFRRMRKTYFPGNLLVGYEQTAGAAAIHTEGGQAVAEEELALGIVELIPQMVKKWISISDEVMDMRGEAFVDYIIDEITDKIIKGVIKLGTDALGDSSLTDFYEAAGASLTTADIVNAEGLLSGEASDVVLITTRANAAALKAAALAAQFGYDPTDGMPIVYVDSLPTTENGTALGIIADLSAVQANFPNGDDVKIKVDDLTLATSDMVKVIGRLYVAVKVVAPGCSVIIGPAGE